MSYTEVQKRHGKEYYYRVQSKRVKDKVTKTRFYMGVDLKKKELVVKEKIADYNINPDLNNLLSKEQRIQLKKLKFAYKNQPNANLDNRYETFLTKFTYDSNAIEGNTLTLQETFFILFDKRTPEGKTLREIHEVVNHKKAFDYILLDKADITKKFICEIQKKVVKNTLRFDLEKEQGVYRSLQVFIRGANFTPPASNEVASEMRKLLLWYTKNKKKLHPLILAAYFHVAFESIHPFVDGNGRTGRLLINFILHKNGYPMLNISEDKKLKYYECLDSGREGNLSLFVNLLYNLLLTEKIQF